MITTVGERIKEARLMAGLSLRDLADRVGVSAQAISKYERGLDKPGSGVLLRLAKALGVRVEYFVRPKSDIVLQPVFRKRAALPRRKEEAALARVREWLERYLEIETLTRRQVPFTYPEGFPFAIGQLPDTETAAEALRKAWQVGVDPIENLTKLLEDHGIKVGAVDAHHKFDACAFWLGPEKQTPVIALKESLPGDRQRMNLAHELGHLLLKPGPGVDEERMAFRFAGAFVVPRQAAVAEIGDRRHTFTPYELHLLKHKYGLSMQAWIYRAKDLGILTDADALALFKAFKAQGWHVKEPGDPYPPERSERLEQLVMHAWSEGAISESRATELLGMSFKDFQREVKRDHGGIPIAVRLGHHAAG
ncbi:MAG TPA: helix-turn-helix domain-containing protein [bacterium]|nr:helix-turn-helix domain-containing protein [bacterium]